MTVVYIDELAALNFIVDYLLLSAAGALGAVCASRLRRMAGALLGAAWACASFLLPVPLLAGAAGKTVCAAAMVLSAFGFEDLRRFIRRCLLLALCGALFAGFVLMAGGMRLSRGGTLYADMPGIVVLALCACAYILLDAVLRLTLHASETQPVLVPVEVEEGGKHAKFAAMRDTGNCLRDPLGGQGVMICELSALRAVLPGPVYACLSKYPEAAQAIGALEGKGWESRFRLIPYSALGTGAGLVCAYRPEKLTVGGKRRRDLLLAPVHAPFAQDAPYRALIGL